MGCSERNYIWSDGFKFFSPAERKKVSLLVQRYFVDLNFSKREKPSVIFYDEIAKGINFGVTDSCG